MSGRILSVNMELGESSSLSGGVGECEDKGNWFGEGEGACWGIGTLNSDETRELLCLKTHYCPELSRGGMIETSSRRRRASLFLRCFAARRLRFEFGNDRSLTKDNRGILIIRISLCSRE